MLMITLTHEYILCDIFAKIHHDFPTGTGAIVWLHTISEVAPKDIDEKRQQHAEQTETQQT